MLTENQKRILENTIYKILKESFFESGKPKKSDENGKSKDTKRQTVEKWLQNDQTNLAPLAYALEGKPHADKNEKGAIRSEFYKKADPDNPDYHFNDDEITSLANMKDRYMQTIDDRR